MSARRAAAPPHMWARLVGQESASGSLRDAVAGDAVGHAYLFVGPEGVGRVLAALALAASVNCLRGGCGTCDVCTRVLRRAHPDVHMLAPEGAQILVDQVRTIRDEAYRSAFEGKTKVFIVEDAERMNVAAASALLKVLEEPPADVVFVLITGEPEELPPTIVSRCRRIDFSPLGPDAIRTILIEHHAVDEERAGWAGRVTSDLASALRLSKDDSAPERRAAHVEIPVRLSRGGPAEAVRVADELKEEVEAAQAALRERQRTDLADHADAYGEGRGTGAMRRRLEDRHKREAKRLERTIYLSALEDVGSFYRDVLVVSCGAGSDALINAELADRVERAARRTDRAWLVTALDRIAATRRALDRNAQPALTLTSLFLELTTPQPARGA
jgi:DNA polymerase III subunit delta'